MLLGYRAVTALVHTEIQMQLQRAANENTAMEALHIPIIMGGVGVGKTSIARAIADALAYGLVKINCGECGDSSEFGMPVPFFMKEGARQAMPWVLNEALLKACDEPVVLFFDDIDKSPSLVEGALLSIFGERTTRGYKLHPQTVVIAAGNRPHDDSLARRLSESLRTRGTVIELEARLGDFAAFASSNPDVVHPAVLGFLNYRPNLLHKPGRDGYRFPTPRSWVEASSQLFRYEPDADVLGEGHKDAWRVFVSLKCGDAAGNDFWAWWRVVSRIDVQKLLTTGEISHNLGAGEDEALVQFAALFAVAAELNTHGPKKEHAGLEKFIMQLHDEHVGAFASMLHQATATKLLKLLPVAATRLMKDIVPLAEGA